MNKQHLFTPITTAINNSMIKRFKVMFKAIPQSILMLVFILASGSAVADDNRFSKHFNQVRMPNILLKSVSSPSQPTKGNLPYQQTLAKPLTRPTMIQGHSYASQPMNTQQNPQQINSKIGVGSQSIYPVSPAISANVRVDDTNSSNTQPNLYQNNQQVTNQADAELKKQQRPTQVSAQHSLSPVDFTNIHINKPMLASMHAVSEICLQILPPRLHYRFEQSFNRQLKQYFPKISDPVLAMQYLSNQEDYQQLLTSWKNKYSEAENIALCEEMVANKK